MSFFTVRPSRPAASLARTGALLGALVLSTTLTGCISVKQYVDPTLPRVAYSDFKPAAVTHPVQVFVEYQTKGATNAKATTEVRPMIIETIKKTALFSDVVTAPALADSKLFVTIDNVPVTKDAASKGFVTGLTFGLAGDMVTDGFVLTAVYNTPGKPEVKHNYQHALHTTIGNAAGPAGLTPAANGAAAIREIVDGLVLNLMKDLNSKGELQ